MTAPTPNLAAIPRKAPVVLPARLIAMMSAKDRKELGVTTFAEDQEHRAAKDERKLQKDCEAWLRLQGICFLHMSHRAREKRGWPDLVFARRSIPYAIELKAEGGKVKPEQAKILAELRANGWHVAVLYSLKAVIEFVEGNS